MARVKFIKSARAVANPEQRRCFTCQRVIEVGESYRKVGLKTGPRSSIKRFWCAEHNPRPSQLTINDRLSTLYGLQEGLEDELRVFSGAADLDSLKSSFEMAADEADSVADSYEESADNMPENLQYSSQAEDLRDRANTVREWAETLRNLDWPEVDGDKLCETCQQPEDDEVHDSEAEKFDHEYEEPEAEEIDLGEAEAAISELSL